MSPLARESAAFVMAAQIGLARVKKRKNHLPQLAGNSSPISAAQEAVGHLWHKGNSCLMVNVLLSRTTRSTSTKVFSSSSVSSLYQPTGLHPLRCRTLHLSLSNVCQMSSVPLTIFPICRGLSSSLNAPPLAMTVMGLLRVYSIPRLAPLIKMLNTTGLRIPHLRESSNNMIPTGCHMTDPFSPAVQPVFHPVKQFTSIQM